MELRRINGELVGTGETIAQIAMDCMANLRHANFFKADLSGARLSGAEFHCAFLVGANLSGTDLSEASLFGTNLSGTNLTGAEMSGTNLGGAELNGTIGNGVEIVTVQTDIWTVTRTSEFMQIGCQRHAISRWWEFTDAQIDAMDGRALEWWRRWKPILQQMIEVSPAKPTGHDPINQLEAWQW